MKGILKYPLYRRTQPSNEINASGFLPEGSVINIEKISMGVPIDNIFTWYQASDGFYYWGGGIKELGFDDVPVKSLSNFFGKLQIGDFWKKGIDGTGVNIAIIDDGFLTTHSALKDFRVVNEYTNDSIQNSLHGTYMATILGGRNFSTGFFGLAPFANFSFYGLGDIHRLTFDDFYSCLSGIKNADIISCSFIKGPDLFGSESKRILIDELMEGPLKNTIICAASGNVGNLQSETYPANYTRVLSLSGIDGGSTPPKLSMHSNFPTGKEDSTFVHPYDGFYDSNIGKSSFSSFFIGFNEANGTSSATAFLAGLFALIVCKFKNDNKIISLESIRDEFFDKTSVFSYNNIELGTGYKLNEEKFLSLLK